jgi:D-alanyl-D-alanine dipeptidase
MLAKGYVASQSSHSRGSAIDLTLFSLESGELLPMGGGFDLMDERSHHTAKGVSSAEAHNRELLHSVMTANGFDPYAFEWWHYVLRDEPYPNSYFDFPIL